MKSKLSLASLIAAACLLFTACNYDFPLTAKPTRPIDERLLGDWVSFDQDDRKEMEMGVRKLDNSTYVVGLDNDIYRVFHSDYAKLPFVSVQDLNSPSRKYHYYVWQLSGDGTQLILKGISTSVVSEQTKDRAAIQRLITQNLTNSKLLRDEIKFTRKKPRGL